jgi:Family of unknown function (DUF5683)
MQQQKNKLFRGQYLLLTSILFCSITCFSQKNIPAKISDDTTKVQPAKLSRYDSAMQAHSPRVAAIRSAILPGLGQVYNKKYWKLPIVYGGLGVSAGVFAYNMKWYKRTRFAYKVLFLKDTASYSKVDPKLQFLVNANALDNLRYYRNQYRRDIDYSVLAFLLLWGLNVVDATVDAHLMSFDVSPDLSLKIKPGHSQMAHTNGLSVILKIGK